MQVSSKSVWKFLAFLWRHYKPFLVKIVSIFSNSPKIHFWSKSPKRSQLVCNTTSATKLLSRIFKILIFFCPQMFNKKLFLTIKTIFRHFKKRNICYDNQYLLCPCQILRQSISLWSPNCPPPPKKKKRETTYDKIFDCNFWKFWTIHKNKNTTVEFAIKTELETNFVWQDQSQNLT